MSQLSISQDSESIIPSSLSVRLISKKFSRPIKQRFRRWKNKWFGPKAPKPSQVPSEPEQQGKKPAEPKNHPWTDTVIVSPNEINSRHGSGILIQYMFPGLSKYASVKSREDYGGEHADFAVSHTLADPLMERHEIYGAVYSWFKHSPPRRVFMVAYYETDLLIGLALKDIFGAKLCFHVMDDNCLSSDEIRPHIIDEVFQKADISFVISPEMKVAYEERFGRRQYVLPPVVENTSFRTPNNQQIEKAAQENLSRRGVIVGNIWDNKWKNMLCTAVQESGIEVDWFCNNPDIIKQKHKLEKAGIFLKDPLWGDDFVNEISTRPYLLMPSGTLDSSETGNRIARLSLPSRLPFVAASSQLPVIVLGNENTAAARFVTQFELGLSIPYEGMKLKNAVQSITEKENQISFRKAAAELSPTFQADGIEKWVWDSTETGYPTDDRFESKFQTPPSQFAYFIDPKPNNQLHWSQQGLWQMLMRMKYQGCQPDTIIDVGASTGIWSWTAAKVFPNAHYVMVDPLMSHYKKKEREYFQKNIGDFELVEAALSDKSGQAEFIVSDDLYGSSLLKVDETIRDTKKISVPICTLDQIAAERKFGGSTLLKIDVQYAEHLVVTGGLQYIASNVDAIILELTIEREHPNAKTYIEMIKMMEELGFHLVDEEEGWRSPRTGRLEQKDSVFVRKQTLAKLKVA